MLHDVALRIRYIVSLHHNANVTLFQNAASVLGNLLIRRRSERMCVRESVLEWSSHTSTSRPSANQHLEVLTDTPLIQINLHDPCSMSEQDVASRSPGDPALAKPVMRCRSAAKLQRRTATHRSSAPWKRSEELLLKGPRNRTATHTHTHVIYTRYTDMPWQENLFYTLSRINGYQRGWKPCSRM